MVILTWSKPYSSLSVQDLPVGCNLQDHVTTLLTVLAPAGVNISTVNPAKAEGSFFDYCLDAFSRY